MTLIESIEDVQNKILLIPRKKNGLPASGPERLCGISWNKSKTS